MGSATETGACSRRPEYCGHSGRSPTRGRSKFPQGRPQRPQTWSAKPPCDGGESGVTEPLKPSEMRPPPDPMNPVSRLRDIFCGNGCADDRPHPSSARPSPAKYCTACFGLRAWPWNETNARRKAQSGRGALDRKTSKRHHNNVAGRHLRIEGAAPMSTVHGQGNPEGPGRPPQ